MDCSFIFLRFYQLEDLTMFAHHNELHLLHGKIQIFENFVNEALNDNNP